MPVNSSIRSYIRTLIGETVENKYLDTEILTAWDYAQKDFSKQTEILQTELSTSWSSGTKDMAITTFPRLIKIRKVVWKWNTTNARVLPFVDFDDYPHAQESQTGQPWGYTTWNDNIRLIPAPDETATVRVYYAFSADSIRDNIALSANSEISQVTERWHHEMAHYAASQIMRKYDQDATIQQKINEFIVIYERAKAQARLLEQRPLDESQAIQFKGLASPAFDGESSGYAGYTNKPIW